MKAFELYKAAREQELKEFNDIAEKVKKYMGEWSTADDEGDYETGDNACVCASTSYSHPTDYDIVKVFWNENDVLRLIGLECDCGCEVELDPSDVEYAHLDSVTEHLTGVVSDYLIEKVTEILDTTEHKKADFSRYITCQKMFDYGFDQTTKFWCQAIELDERGELNVLSDRLEQMIKFSIYDVILEERIDILEQMYEELSENK